MKYQIKNIGEHKKEIGFGAAAIIGLAIGVVAGENYMHLLEHKILADFYGFVASGGLYAKLIKII